mmetsp:Transcript_43001/g.69769  ORF Transcript_43001/g.69769 Transcript_43001/m.69769 type:complete len:121 (+) Transcript_43001:190-552(+)
MSFAVTPKTDCPHVHSLDPGSFPSGLTTSEPCETCGDRSENWICLSCFHVFCSRYVNAHLLAHNEAQPEHPIALSFSDLSLWCFSCDSYISNPSFQPILDMLHPIVIKRLTSGETSSSSL